MKKIMNLHNIYVIIFYTIIDIQQPDKPNFRGEPDSYMKKYLIFIAVFVYAITATSFSGPQFLYASRTDNREPLMDAASTALNESGMKRPRDFKITEEIENENTIYTMSSIVIESKTDGSSTENKTLTWKKSHLVVIDPGHGGIDPGAIDNGLVEKEINLDIALRVNTLLSDYGVKTYMVRTDDSAIDPKDRIYTANDKKASLYLSIHCNWFKDPSFHGAMTLYYPSETLKKGNLTELDYALTIQGELSGGLPMENRGIIDRSNLSVLRRAVMPSVLVELGFMSNKGDALLLGSEKFRQQAAEALAMGVLESLAKID